MSGVASTPEQVERYASCTLLSASLAELMTPDAEKPKENSIQACVKFLEENEFIRFILISEFVIFSSMTQ